MTRLLLTACCIAALQFGAIPAWAQSEPVDGVTVYSLDEALPQGAALRQPSQPSSRLIGQPMVLQPVPTQAYTSYEPEVVQGPAPQETLQPLPESPPQIAWNAPQPQFQPQVQPQVQPQPVAQPVYAAAAPQVLQRNMTVPADAPPLPADLMVRQVQAGAVDPATDPLGLGVPVAPAVVAAPVNVPANVPGVAASYNAGAVSLPVQDNASQAPAVRQAGVVSPIVDDPERGQISVPDVSHDSGRDSVPAFNDSRPARPDPAVSCPGNRSAEHEPAEFASSMAQKMALLEKEKEDLRHRLGVAQTGDFKVIGQCVAQDNRITELEAQVNFLQEQNASLKKAQDEAVAAANAAMEQMADHESKGGALSTPDLPPLDRPDLPEADAPAPAKAAE